MVNKTTNYELEQPTSEEFYDVEVQNRNMQKIDTELKNLEDNMASSTKLTELENDLAAHTEQNNTSAHTIDNIEGLQDALDNTVADTSNLQSNLLGLAIELEMLKAAEITGVDSNIFIETFQNVDDLLVLNGAYNTTGKCIEV